MLALRRAEAGRAERHALTGVRSAPFGARDFRPLLTLLPFHKIRIKLLTTPLSVASERKKGALALWRLNEDAS